MLFDCIKQLNEIFTSTLLGSSEAVARRCFVKEMFLKISQNSLENIRARVSFLIKVQAWDLAQVYYCEFCEMSKSKFLIEHLRWLLLEVHITNDVPIFSFVKCLRDTKFYLKVIAELEESMKINLSEILPLHYYQFSGINLKKCKNKVNK